MTSARQAIKEGRTLVGSWISTGSPIAAELMAACGFDFLAVDVEHSAVDLPQTQQLFQAIRSGNPNCAPFVRLHGVDYAFAKRYLDAGARGVIGPLVNTAEEALRLIEAVKYPPAGKRGVGFCRANQYGMFLQAEFEKANDEILVAVQIEHVDGVNNIEQILLVQGIDAVFIGPYDLSASMGLTGQFEHPDFVEAKGRILKACGARGVAAGIHVVHPDAEEFIKQAKAGYQLMAYSLDITMLVHSCQTALSTIRKKLSAKL